MKVHEKQVLVCDCEQTMTFDAAKLAAPFDAGAPFVHTHLCRSQIDNFRRAVESSRDLVVCCTQEAPLFAEIASEIAPDHSIACVNIRERAGWSAEGRSAEAKMAALIAEAALDIDPTPAVELASDGVTLIYGSGEMALSAARQLAGRLNVTCLLKSGDGAVPPPVMNVPVFQGVVRKASGRLGAFEVTIDSFAASSPSARAGFAFLPGRDGAVLHCDVLVDLSGDTPLFPAPDKRDGYVRAEPSDPVAVQRALFAAADLVGRFEKPRYLKIDPAICAHKRNEIVGCDLCFSDCPTGAVVPDGDHASVDAAICSGHGACASVCPTGAIVFDLPRGSALLERLRTLTRTFHVAGGTGMVLLIHDARHGEEMLNLMARAGRGLPAAVVPFAVNEITQIGLDVLLSALAYGGARIRILAGPEHRDSLEPLRRHAKLVDVLATGLGYAGNPVVIDEVTDPSDLEERLYGAAPRPKVAKGAAYRALDDKRTTLRLALRHIHAEAPAPVDVLEIPAGAPFGRILLDVAACTLCLNCVGACPTGALGDNPDTPQLTFTEERCVQCGLCRNTCPENAITLKPRIDFTEAARRKVVLKEEVPFCCIRCGKPFGTRTTIERLVERLSGHSMFAAPGKLDLIKMCEDCRVVAQFEETEVPFAASPRPVPRTTDDYLEQRNRRDIDNKFDDNKD